MSQRREIETHARRLGELREILTSMKTLANIETRKLTRRLENQQRIVAGIEETAGDFLSCYPYSLARDGRLPEVYIAIGTERGFCGDLNERVRRRLGTCLASAPGPGPIVVAVGRRLFTKLEECPAVGATLEGADTVEEAERLVVEIVGKTDALCGGEGAMKLVAVYARDGRSEVAAEPVLPPFLDLIGTPPARSEPLLLNLEPVDFLVRLVDQYLLAKLQEIVYASLMNEDQRRIQHLEGAVRHLDERIAGLRRRGAQLRQEEIIEEIEVILLGAS